MADKANQYLQSNIDLIKQADSAYSSFLSQLQANEAKAREFATAIMELNKNLKSATTVKAFSDAQKELRENIKSVAEAEKEQIRIQKEAEKLEQERIKTAQQKLRLQKQQESSTAKLNSLYKQESARLTELRNKAKDVALQFGLSSNQFKIAAKEVNNLDQKLRKIDSALGQNQRNVGAYSTALNGLNKLMGAAGIAGGATLLFNTLRNGFNITRNYEKANAVLASVLGKTLDQTTALQEQSREYGETTVFTATQVTELHTALARLGKTEPEILDMTKGVIDATVAMGGSTEETATLIGATLTTYQKNAKESGKVADILTLATQRSALSFEKLKTMIPIAAGAAAAANVPLEKLVAQLGKAADRGIDASSAATSIRNIYIELSKKGLTLSEAFDKINNSQNKLSTATTIFGKRTAVTALALASTTKETEDLQKALENSGGTAKKVAETQLDTLDGRVKLLNSAFEGLVLNLFDTDGAMGSVIKTGIEAGTLFLNLVNRLFSVSGAYTSVSRAIKAMEGTYSDTKSILDDSNNARELLIDNLMNEGLGYEEAKKQADEYLTTLKDINSEVGKQVQQDFLVGMLQSQLDQMKAFGAPADAIIAKEKELVNVQDKIKYSSIDLKKATSEELQEYLKLEQSYFELSDAKKEFIKLVYAEIAARNEGGAGAETEETKGLIEQLNTEIKLKKELLKQAGSEEEIKKINREIEALEKKLKTLKELGIEQVPDQIKTLTIKTDTQEQTLEELEALDQKEIDLYLDKELEKTKILEEAERERLQLQQQMLETFVSSAFSMLGSLFDYKINQIDDELSELDDYYSEKLDNENLDAEQQAAIIAEQEKAEEKLQAKKAKLEKQQFLLEQADALAQVAMNTAQGVSLLYATFPPPVAAGLTPLVIGIGAAQAAVIGAQTIAQYDKGTDSLPALSEIAEKRPEILIHDGKPMLVTSPTILGSEYKGDRVIGGAETANILETVTRMNLIDGIKGDKNRVEQMMLDAALRQLNNSYIKGANDIVNAINRNAPKDNNSGLSRMNKTRDYIKKHRK